MKYLLILISLICLLQFGCNSVTDSSEENLATQRIIESDSIEYTLIINKSKFSLKDTLEVTFQVLNKSQVKKEFKFNNTPLLGFQLVNTFGKTAMFYPFYVNPTLSSFSLLPQESKILSISCTFTDYNGNYIDVGIYDLIVYLANNNSPEVSLKIRIN
jgi:hypothetical protein